MDARRLTRPALVGLLAVCCACSLMAQNADVAVVVNPNNPVVNVTTTELRNIFAGEKHSWPKGVPIKLIVRAPGCQERLTLLKLLGMSESEYKQYWTAMVFRGDASSEPVAVYSNGMAKEAVAVIPGAIALVDAKDLKPGMKVVKIDGHLAGEAGYPLH